MCHLVCHLACGQAGASKKGLNVVRVMTAIAISEACGNYDVARLLRMFCLLPGANKDVTSYGLDCPEKTPCPDCHYAHGLKQQLGTSDSSAKFNNMNLFVTLMGVPMLPFGLPGL